MKKQQLVALALATTLAGGLGTLAGCGSADDTGTGAQPNAAVSTPAAPATTQTPAPSTALDSVDDLVLSPGAVGPVKVGMTKAELTATKLFEVVPPAAEGCNPALAWVAPFAGTFDVQVKKNGELASIGVLKAGPTTGSGLGVGSTLADVLAANTGAKTVEAGYGQTGVRVYDSATKGWIGYLFDVELKDAKSTDKVTFIELTEGEQPSLMRDGC